MNHAELVAAFKRDKVDASALSTRQQTQLALRFARMYERHGLIKRGKAPPLWDCCPNARDCWREALDARPSEGPEDGGISLPWIGSAYGPGGVVVLGINFNDANGLTRAYEIAPEDAIELAAGRRRVKYGLDHSEYRGSDFPYRSTRSAALLCDHLNGDPVLDREDPREVAPFVDRIVRIQAIKCSPRNEQASKPTDDMWANCPPLLLEDELRIAEPGAIVGFGTDVRWVLEQLSNYEVQRERKHVRTGAIHLGDRAIPVYLIAHPRSTTWPAGHRALRTFLQRSTDHRNARPRAGAGQTSPRRLHPTGRHPASTSAVFLMSCGSEDFRFPDEWITAFADRPVAETHIAKWWSSARPAQVHAGDISVLVATKSGKVMGAFQVMADPVEDGSHPTRPDKWPWTVLLRPLVLLDGTVAPRLRDFQLTAPHRYKAVKDTSTAAALLDAIHPMLTKLLDKR